MEKIQDNSVENKKEKLDINFEINNAVDSPADYIEIIKNTLSAVWKKNIGVSTVFKVKITAIIMNPETSEEIPISSWYDPDKDEILFGTYGLMRLEQQFKIDFEAVLLIAAAHETMHRVQFERGKNVPASLNNKSKFVKDYTDNKYEIEAWDEALKLLKHVYPTAKGDFMFGKNKLEIPEASDYKLD